MSSTREKAPRAEETTMFQPSIYISSDNGQMACADHRKLYGRISWHRMTPAEVAAMKAAVADILPASESLCEICNRPYRMAKIAARDAQAGVAR